VHYYKPDIDDWELLDRQTDPLETKNFYNDPAYKQIAADLRMELDRLRKEVGDDQPVPRMAYGNQPFDGEPQVPSKANQKGKGGKAGSQGR
jgi:hypothetical protein